MLNRPSAPNQGSDGHRLYFYAALHGALLFVLSLILVLGFRDLLRQTASYVAFEHTLTNQLTPLFKERATAKGQIGFVVICFASMLLGPSMARVVNWLGRRQLEALVWKEVQKDDLEAFLYQALTEVRLVSLTLSSNKVYVGWVLTASGRGKEPDESRRVVTLMPLMSGVRTETGKVSFTTFYDRIYESEGVDPDAFRLIVPLDKVVSLSNFDPAAYNKFNEADIVAASKDRSAGAASSETDESRD